MAELWGKIVWGVLALVGKLLGGGQGIKYVALREKIAAEERRSAVQDYRDLLEGERRHSAKEGKKLELQVTRLEARVDTLREKLEELYTKNMELGAEVVDLTRERDELADRVIRFEEEQGEAG